MSEKFPAMCFVLGTSCGAVKCKALRRMRYSKREGWRDRLMAAGMEGERDRYGASQRSDVQRGLA